MAWDPGCIYVVGHQRPDSDAIGSALAYAWYLQQTGEQEAVAARCGHPGSETRFALERWEMEAPLFLPSVWSTCGHAARRPEALAENVPLGGAMARMAAGERAIPVVDDEQRPVGALTAAALARSLMGGKWEAQLGTLVDKVPVFAQDDRVADQRTVLMRSDFDDFLVADPAGRYVGIAPRFRLINPPRARLILVDHNELDQAVPGAQEADILAVLDHHKLGNPSTKTPIRFVVEPIGCTCTLITELCRMRNLTPPRGLMGMMATGLLSDTLVFRSPTTTERDREAGRWLAEQLGIDLEAYGKEMLKHAPGLSAPIDDIVDGDRKAFRIDGLPLSIAQVEVTSLGDLPERRETLLAALDERLKREGLAFIALMVTDVVEGESRLLWRGERRIARALPFARTESGELDLGQVVSRKKQLVPAFYAALEA